MLFWNKKIVPLYLVVAFINAALWLGKVSERSVWVWELTEEKMEQGFEERFGFKSIPPKQAESNPIWERRNELKLAFLNQESSPTPAYASPAELQVAVEDGKRERKDIKAAISDKRTRGFSRLVPARSEVSR